MHKLLLFLAVMNANLREELRRLKNELEFTRHGSADQLQAAAASTDSGDDKQEIHRLRVLMQEKDGE